MQTKKIEIYSTPTCHFCHLAKDYFNANNITYTEYNVATDTQKRDEMIEITGQRGVPVIVVDGDIMVGFNETAFEEQFGKL